ncbi:response regulator [uncultured Dokdonia sp.]|uniref:response regulator n=1 Tax=uncultured Dokdonia sp. TaxID=575653 RepID=UPI002635CC58|nr:response regulator [uncultured Dokdonia sp.]
MKNRVHKILLVDDNKATNFFNKQILKKYGFEGEIVVKTDGLEAIEEIENSEMADVIFLDINMPIMNGFEFLEKIQTIEAYKLYNPLIVIMMGVELPTEDVEKIKRINNVLLMHRKMLSNESIDEVLSYLPEGVAI